ncbi:AAA family ATPase [Serpentinicella alkaliphila]|uniref:ExeA family protein n=1 Tax=Serpentinicella alkaliphila TaxID=1734049 RepID=UPI001BC83119|nr:AAA family ATPase [Serpentinicella alkaliphila]QUH26171.1 AAA family ATPase [Serpentinicella alkaliphila]
MIDYISRYGLDFNPFIKNTKDIVVETSEYNEIIYRLNYLLNNKGFGVITGGPGRGKTTKQLEWVNGLNNSLYKVIYTSLSTLTVSEFYKHLSSELGLEPMHKKTDNFKNIQAEINRYSIEKRITPVIIIDEANYINNAVLNDLKMLFNFDMDSKDRAVVILVGLPQLNNTLRLVANEPLRQRVTITIISIVSKREESLSYIKGKLSGAKSTLEIFNANALEAIINASNGIPRLINKICNSSLIIANSKNANIVDSDIVMLAVNEIELG